MIRPQRAGGEFAHHPAITISTRIQQVKDRFFMFKEGKIIIGTKLEVH